MLFKPFWQYYPSALCKLRQNIKKWRNARSKIPKEKKNTIHNLQVEVKEKKMLQERNEMK